MHTHIQQRRKWTHYFWEFSHVVPRCVLWFPAEYKLEHTIATPAGRTIYEIHDRGPEGDILMLEKNVALRKSRLTMIDSLVELLNSPHRDKYGNDIYFFARSSSPPVNIFPNDGTIQQLKSSGNLRLIRNNHNCQQHHGL
jgi:hypothetical protein